MAAQRIPLNFFGMSFGLTGLAGCWVTVGDQGHVSDVVGDAFRAFAADGGLSRLPVPARP
ncbi:hypothetical protein ABZ707_06630 [Streptomyces sp. NPDC006923]|uniref:hypothetical protein n=1 Tax=Streptomyces sp. NPDC006923 TaxID=3155355 RepID=UPI0033D38349